MFIIVIYEFIRVISRHIFIFILFYILGRGCSDLEANYTLSFILYFVIAYKPFGVIRDFTRNNNVISLCISGDLALIFHSLIHMFVHHTETRV
jgi:hypothetical protein